MPKNFIIAGYQIFGSAHAGADAVLLIAAARDRGMPKALLHEASSLGMETMVEIHEESDLYKALGAGAGLIGINNRNLRTMEVDLAATIELIPKIPDGKITVSESGIREPEDIRTLSQYGIKAVLVGTAFMEANDIASEVKRVMDW
jgi:indole-3-glycerol phosphate synthase